jgi:hypothetical protein
MSCKKDESFCERTSARAIHTPIQLQRMQRHTCRTLPSALAHASHSCAHARPHAHTLTHSVSRQRRKLLALYCDWVQTPLQLTSAATHRTTTSRTSTHVLRNASKHCCCCSRHQHRELASTHATSRERLLSCSSTASRGLRATLRHRRESVVGLTRSKRFWVTSTRMGWQVRWAPYIHHQPTHPRHHHPPILPPSRRHTIALTTKTNTQL